MPCGRCIRCVGLKHKDRVRDTTGQLGYGTVWVVDGDIAFVQFGDRGPVDVRVSTLELAR